MTQTMDSKHDGFGDALWQGETPTPPDGHQSPFERSVTKLVERPTGEELCRFAFAGVMPTPSDRGHRLSTARRERIGMGLLRVLQPGEIMETRYRRTESGRLEWDLAAFAEQRAELAHSRRVELSLGWQAVLHELRYGYRFAPQPCDAASQANPRGSTIRLRAGGRWLQTNEGQIGFVTPTRSDFALRLPTAMSSTRSRIF